MEVRGIITSPYTGKVTGQLNEGDRIVRAESKEFLNSTIKMQYKRFVKLNIDELEPLLPTLTATERALLMGILPYVSYRDSCLQYANGKDLNLEAISRVTATAENTCSKAIQGLIDKDVVYKGRNSKNNQYFVNPWIANKGLVVNKVLKRMFQNYNVLSMGGVKWKDLPDYR